MDYILIQKYIIDNYILLGTVIGMYFVLSMQSSIDNVLKKRMAINLTLVLLLSLVHFHLDCLNQEMEVGIKLSIVGAIYCSLRPLIMATGIYMIKPQNKLIFMPAIFNFFIYFIFCFKIDIFYLSVDGVIKSHLIGYSYIVVEWIYWILFLFIINMIFYKKNMVNKLATFFCISVVMTANIVETIGAREGILTNTYAIVFVFYFLVIHVYISKQVAEEKEMKLREQRVSLMLSQIQPHFLYNTLNTITALCRTNPRLAEETTIKFSMYLRENMHSMGESDTHPFSQELEHTNIYLDIEKLRFGDRVNVEYDIQCDDFEIPMLTLQPIVENAVKHGICKKLDGGTVKISTEKKGRDRIITIEDDGVGFEIEKALNDGKIHIGIQNVKERLNNMINADMEITSLVGFGTTVRIIIPDKRQNTKIEGGERREILSFGR